MTDAEMDELMKANATDAVAAAGRRDVVLDFTEDSLNGVDELLGRESFIGETPRTPESDEDEKLLWSCAQMFGGYVGEVVLRTMGGRWIADPTSDGGVRAAILIGGARGFPVGKVWKRLTEDQFSTLGGYCRALRVVLANQAKRRAEGS
ncbi:MAG: hypothetical protein K8T90_07670 [Planctomycetes bacterium]|nr:hypothetical protein [Planctomycetota bacterium]